MPTNDLPPGFSFFNPTVSVTPTTAPQAWVPTASVAPSYDTPTPKEPWATANPRVNADPVFNAQLLKLLKHYDGVSEQRLRNAAGGLTHPLKSINPDGDICETAMQCLMACIPHMDEPKGLREKVEGNVVKQHMREAKQQADATFKSEWGLYLEACAQRKQRIADAKTLEKQKLTVAALRHLHEMGELQKKHAAELAEIREERRRAELEPAPVMPRKGAGSSAQSHA